jgi:hypothetical protein
MGGGGGGRKCKIITRQAPKEDVIIARPLGEENPITRNNPTKLKKSQWFNARFHKKRIKLSKRSLPAAGRAEKGRPGAAGRTPAVPLPRSFAQQNSWAGNDRDVVSGLRCAQGFSFWNSLFWENYLDKDFF